METIHVQVKDHRYPVYIGAHLLSRLPSLLKQAGIREDHKLMLVSDSNVFPLYGRNVVKELLQAGFNVGSTVIPAGESSKNYQQVQYIIEKCIDFGLDRKSTILALGGGMVGDISGFVSSIYMRGISVIQLPTTILSHDSSIGGKVGINHPLGKNYIGALHHPKMVVLDTDTFHTLPKRQCISGYAEVIKHALIQDQEFARWLLDHSASLVALQKEKVEEGLKRSCQIKATIVCIDETEQDVRSLLNYGHTIGHALESITNYKEYTHGEAISVGMVAASCLSQKVLGAPLELITQTKELLQAFELPISPFFRPLPLRDILETIKRDKKAHQGEYTFVLSTGVGKSRLVRGIQENCIERVLEELLG